MTRKLRRTPEGRYKHERELYVEKCLAIYHLPKPTIAQVQGHCVAAGLMLAAMCDLIVAADDALFANPVLRMTGAGVELLVEPWELGFRKAKEFLWTGDAIDAREAWRLGLVNRIVPRKRLAAETLATQFPNDPEALTRAAAVSTDFSRATALLNHAVAIDSAASIDPRSLPTGRSAGATLLIGSPSASGGR